MKYYNSIKTRTPGKIFYCIPLCWLFLCFAGFTSVKTIKSHVPAISSDSLAKGFISPPDSIKTLVYWYWINGNISKEGITSDLESMAKVGIGEAFIGNIGQIEGLSGKVRVLSDEWWQLTQYAIREGKRLGVNIGIFNCPGWAQSGGPLVKPSETMRYMVSSEVIIDGGRQISKKLTAPKDTFQDIAVIAFPAPLNDAENIADYKPKVSTNPQIKDAALLFDDDIQKTILFPQNLPDSTITIDMELAKPFTVRSLILYPGETPFYANAELQAYKNGSYEPVIFFIFDRSNPDLSVGPIPYGEVAIALPQVTADKYRLVLSNLKGIGGLREIRLSSSPKLERYIEKQMGKMFQTPHLSGYEYQWPVQTPTGTDDMKINLSKVIDLTKNMSGDGTLNWNAPPGKWIIMRFGMTPTGMKNKPASPEATGFEVDKMNRQYITKHYDNYIGKILLDMPAQDRTALKHVVADSYETGPENWTEGFADAFKRRYGYNPLSWLPVLSGRIIGTADQSDRFLWDLRRLVADRIAYDYVGELRKLAMKNGLRLWLENYGHWGFPSEFLMYGGQSNDIAGEFWAKGDFDYIGNVELRAASSAAHIYGKNRVYAESYTAEGNAFGRYPGNLKKRGDWSFTEGINHVLLHVYIHQPYEDKNPGINAWFGTEFNRKNTWFDQAKTWIDYQRRCMFMLQQGKPVNDVCYYIGEDAPKMAGTRIPELPNGYSYDYINAEVIEKRLSLHDGRFVLPDGMSYRMMVLPPLETMRPEVLKRIRDLVAAGGIILGPKPLRSPSMQNFLDADNEVKRLANELWGGIDGKIVTSQVYGKGLVLTGIDMQQALNRIKVNEDFSVPEKTPVLFTHRCSDSNEIYFITNQSDSVLDFIADFRVEGKQPELWDATNGSIRNLPQFSMHNGSTNIPLHLEPAQSYFVVFRKATLANGTGNNFPEGQVIQNLNVGWLVSFDRKMRGPLNPVKFVRLVDWSKNENDSIKYYSGTAFYRNDFNLNNLQDTERIILDLGEVKNMAMVKVNGKSVGGLWTAPWQIDITNAVKGEINQLEIEVVNTWVNRLIGDSKLPEEQRLSWASVNTFKATDPLEPSGLIGPVTLKIIK